MLIKVKYFIKDKRYLYKIKYLILLTLRYFNKKEIEREKEKLTFETLSFLHGF